MCSRAAQARRLIYKQFDALRFLYQCVLREPAPWFNGLTRPRKHRSLPVVLSESEVGAILDRMNGVPKLMASLL